MPGARLTAEQRRTIERCYRMGLSLDQIASIIDKHKSTVSRELSRSFSAPGSRSPRARTARGGGAGYRRVYDAERAQRYAEVKGRRPKAHRLDHAPLREQVWELLRADWSPEQIKSALVNRADLVIKDAITGVHDVGPRAQGSGRENLSVAADASVWMDPASASFRKIPVGNATSVDITLYNPTGNDQTFTVSATKFIPDTFGGTVASIYNAGTLSAGDDQITVPASVVVPANGSTTLTVSVSGNLAPDTVVQGWINLHCDDNPNHDLHFAYGGRVEPKQ